MPQLVPISRDLHSARAWKRPSSLSFASGLAIAPLFAQELAAAAMAFPIAFTRENGAAEGGFVPAALFGFEPGQNLFLGPQNQWIGRYVPLALRYHPFQLARMQDEQLALCILDDFMTHAGAGEPFFTEAGEPSEEIGKILTGLNQMEAGRQTMMSISAVLDQHGLIEPWPIKVQKEAGLVTIDGLFRIHEAKLKESAGDVLAELMQSSALPAAYCQLLSMQHLPTLGQLAQMHQKAQGPRLPINAAGELDMDALVQSESIDFSRLG